MSITKQEMRRLAIDSYNAGHGTQAEMAHFYNVDIRTFQRWLARYKKTGEDSPRKRGHRKAIFSGEHLNTLDKLVQDNPDSTLEELKVLSNTTGSIMSVKRALDRLGYRYKKTLHASEQEREDVKLKRQQWLEELPDLDPFRLVFLDESSAKTNMTRQRGRAKHGERLFAKAPFGHWCTTTMISSIRLSGETAAMEIGGATDSVVFREYVKKILAPTLSPADIVVMDNLTAHYDAEAISMIEARGAIVKFLPPYSPDFNPIEKMWSKIKELLRSISARTKPDLSTAITRAFEAVTPNDVQGWFSSCHITASHS